MKSRKFDFHENGIYHICNKSIANFNILVDYEDVERFTDLIEYCNSNKDAIPYSTFNKSRQRFFAKGLLKRNDNQIVTIIAYCIMPDHYHLLLKSKIPNEEFYTYISRFENSYSKYFNSKIHRNGPLWQSRFRAVRIKNNEQLLHVSRYIHLNPTTKKLVDKPEDWENSSYRSYLNQRELSKIDEISIADSNRYKKFIDNNRDYQRKLKLIQKLILER